MSLLVSLLLDELIGGELMTHQSVVLGNVSEDLQRFKVLLTMTPTLLLTSPLVPQALTDLNPLFTVLVEQYNEFDPLLQGPEVRFIARCSRRTEAPLFFRVALSCLNDNIFFLKSSLILGDHRAEERHKLPSKIVCGGARLVSF